MSAPFGSLPSSDAEINPASQIVLSAKQNIEANGLFAFNQEEDQKAKELKAKAEAIDAYFKEHSMPLAGTGLKMAQEAEANDLEWPLLAAIAVRESTGGKHACKKKEFNPFGWGSCKIGFESYDQAIETVGRHIGGNAPSTVHHYADKNTKEILQTYNPPSVVPKYAEQVMKIMKDIESYLVVTPDTNINNKENV